MKITSKYLVLPINMKMRLKTVLLSEGDGRLIFDFEAHLDPLTPQFYTYLDVERFRGMDLTVSVEPDMEIEFAMTDTKPVGSSYLRPSVHFSADYGWLNDPNGLVYYNGIYHLFYQINPVETDFGSMHWGHAVSTDLLHWEDGEIALYPDDMGTMFSGCGIIDEGNVTGLSENGDAMLLFYTAAAEHTRTSMGKKFTQCMAYSTDGGKTITKYEKNPVVENYALGNRDPKVVWVEELDAYVMAIFLADDRRYLYRLLESKNLLDWTPLQDITIREGTEECPDLYSLEADGEKKWVFCGADDTYVIGSFDKGARRFVAETEPKKLHYGNASYAGQTYSNTPGRRIKVVCNVFRDTGAQFSSQMGIPMEMSLSKLGGEYYLKGCPVPEFDSLSGNTEAYHGNTEVILSKQSAYDITVKAPKDADDFSVTVFGEELVVKPRENLMIYRKHEVPLSVTGEDVNLRIITDTFTLECSLDGGFVNAVFGVILDKSLNKLNVTSERADITVKELESIFN
ncbi:MAG: glycoside hydrolase family 32 protein [Ruminococcaceae bacterium]|nr:glycoside hydrolase family 32 protein [Oscillospiraceae bacterium]